MVCPEKKVIARVAAALRKLWDGQEERRKVSVQSGQGIWREQSVFTSVQSLNNSNLEEKRRGMSNTVALALQGSCSDFLMCITSHLPLCYSAAQSCQPYCKAFPGAGAPEPTSTLGMTAKQYTGLWLVRSYQMDQREKLKEDPSRPDHYETLASIVCRLIGP